MTVRGKLTIHTKARGAELGDLYGIFFEDLNHAADGGLYAELVQNRSFEFDPIDRADYHALTAWEKVERGDGIAELRIETAHPIHPRNEHYAGITIISEGAGVGIMNRGFNTGIPIKRGEKYVFSMYARRDASYDEPVLVAIESLDGTVQAQASIMVTSAEWSNYDAELTSDATDNSCRLVITTKGRGTLYLDMVSLFPVHTFCNRPNGLREDIALMIAELKPKFMRFPGGCLVHDGSLNPDDRDSMYRWKNTIGDLAQRPARRSNWGYNQTLGLGYLEYFQFCEDIGAKPIPVLPAGYDPHHKRIVPIEELQPWIDDALNLIEFANGDSTTPWGAIRSKLGHPEPFGMTYIGIGNEEVDEPFFERYTYFHRAIKEAYPDIKIINSSGPFAAGGEYDRGWKSARENRSDLVDEHYYMSPEWFLAHHRRYDSFSADDPKVFLGEYASCGNTYYNALAEAAYMTGLERNAHAVKLACYAPLLCNADYVNWKPDLIWFNNHAVYGTANYYVQKMFMNNQGDRLLQIEAEGFKQAELQPDTPITGGIAVGCDGCKITYSEIRLTNLASGEIRTLGDRIELSDSEVDRADGTSVRIAELGHTDWTHYSITMNAKKHSGSKGFIVYFGRKDDSNQLFWEAGGWQNQDSMIQSRINGRNSVLTQRLFEAEVGVEYELALEVEGRRIRVSINGEFVSETVDLLPVIEPLYFTSSIEEATGDVIVKAVNVQDTNVAAHIELTGTAKRQREVEVIEMSGYELHEENSFATPERILPRNKMMTAIDSEFDYDFPKHSITVLRIKSCESVQEGTESRQTLL